mmetsp:Transcript_24482/g.56396  ORF Transcript_24482/g.56396 Transcript_24482/m.56396 type:complete len:209 (+) Transcript_24482:1207-1833(+)
MFLDVSASAFRNSAAVCSCSRVRSSTLRCKLSTTSTFTAGAGAAAAGVGGGGAAAAACLCNATGLLLFVWATGMGKLRRKTMMLSSPMKEAKMMFKGGSASDTNFADARKNCFIMSMPSHATMKAHSKNTPAMPLSARTAFLASLRLASESEANDAVAPFCGGCSCVGAGGGVASTMASGFGSTLGSTFGAGSALGSGCASGCGSDVC